MAQTHVFVLLLALAIGVVAGLRALTPPAIVAWAAFVGWLHLDHTWASWMGHIVVVVLLTILAVVELITDKLPKTPSRRTAMQFVARIVTGGFAGAVIGAGFHYTWSSLGAGVVGAVLGTLAGSEARRWLASKFGRDYVAAVIEDDVAVAAGLVVAFLTSVV